MKLRTIVVDDQDELRSIAVKALQQIDLVDVIYSTCEPADFLKAVLSEKPDLLIMDIDMPDMNGIELAEKIQSELPDIEIVYVTSHDEYIRDAISVYATDFITKPLDQARLCETIERIARKLNITGSAFEIRSNKSTVLICINELFFVEAQNKKVLVHTTKGIYEADHSLKEIIAMIESQHMYQSGRSFYINLTKVNSVVPFNRTSLEITFNGTENTALLSKKQYDEFRDLIKQL